MSRRRHVAALGLLALGACVKPLASPLAAPAQPAPVEVQILAINDFHGNLEPPKRFVEAVGPGGATVQVPAGGAAHLAAAAKALRAQAAHSVTVSAGDMIGASPLVSALFLDEPTIEAMEEVGVEFNAVGNHEFDKGSAELLRMQRGGCDKHTSRQPCRVEPFDGADFKFLAANVLTASGGTLFPATAIKDFGPVQLGLIGMTLKETATVVTPAGVAGLTFADEAATANAAVPGLSAAGADAIVVILHQGGRTTGGYNDKSCPGFSGDILPIVARLDRRIDVVVSGHTHAAYVCEIPRSGARPLLVTSAGQYGTLLTDIRLTFSPQGLIAHRADNLIVQGEGYSAGSTTVATAPDFPIYPADAPTKALVDRYADASAAEAARVVGRLSGPATREPTDDREQAAGNLIADAQLAASRDKGAQIAFINSGGIRADLVPGTDGSVTYGQIFAVQPFGNNLVVKTLTGAQLKAVLEQQFKTPERPVMLFPSKGFEFAYDLSRPVGERIVAMGLAGRSIDPGASYRVSINNFLASGGDGFTTFGEGTDPVDAGLDLDALAAFLKNGASVPATGRIDDRTPR